jgi:serine/threonine-protein kinase
VSSPRAKEFVAMEPANESNTRTVAIPDFLQAIRSSSLLSERQVEKLEANVAEGNYPPEPAELASRLVKDGVLTEFQARQLLKGKPQGLTFGGYVILDFLGKGTMGKVYKARHRMMGRVVALKILDSRYITSTRSLARFQREMQLVGRLDHPNVVRAFDADRVGDCYFIAMEYVAGETLEDVLKARGALPPADVVYYASLAADGLAHAHSRGVVHRDIKPSNLMMAPGRKLKVLDFGLGTLLEKDELAASLTNAGFAVGTPDYISPEQARMVKIDGRSDLYSLGCTMYHLLSGKLPFKGESSMDCIVGRITGQAVPISEVVPGLPPRLVQSIEKLMATNPDDRYQTAEETATALRSMLRPKNASPGISASTEAAIAPVPTPVRKEAPTEAAIAPVPAPVRKEDPTIEAPPLPARAGTRLSKPKSGPRRLRWAGPRAKAGRVLGVVAVAGASLIVGTILLFRSSNDRRPASQEGTNDQRPASQEGTNDQRPASREGTLATKNGPGLPPGGADARRSSLVIDDPKPGASVGMREDLTGRIESEGWPVIFVQADIPGQPWWSQAPVEKLDAGRFSTKVVFGDEFTPPGTKFRIAGIVTRTREEALKFTMGSKLQALPEGYPQSVEVVVTHR